MEHLGTVIRDIQVIAVDDTTLSQGLAESVEHAYWKVKEIRAFIDSQLYHAGLGKMQARRKSVFRQKGQIKTFVEDISGISTELSNHISVITLEVIGPFAEPRM